ncbi:aminoacyl-tRNA hydrolase [bacterium]|nr:aminoacyl-tRNA hydrolase [bacterium]|tara:strand:- start:1329 stop:1919 length:591 start_codon:yes stop_codon:yes gene_type:complete
MFYIFGLGNPGGKYDGTRHNVGRDVLKELGVITGFSSWQKDKYANAQKSAGQLLGKPVEFWLPETFMNLSGETVWYVVDNNEAKPEQVVVLYDDVDLPLGEVKISLGKGDGGHNGIKSVISSLGSKDFIRIRIGVASKSFWTGETSRPSGEKLSKHVLGKFGYFEKGNKELVLTKVHEILDVLVTEGATVAMNKFN